MAVLGQGALGRRHCSCKGPEVGMSLARPAPLGQRQLRGKGVKARERKWASGWTPQGLWDCAETLGELGQCF